MNIERVKYLIRKQQRTYLELGENQARFEEWLHTLPIKEFREHQEALRVMQTLSPTFGYRCFLDALEDFSIDHGDFEKAREVKLERWFLSVDDHARPAPKGPVILGPAVVVFVDFKGHRDIRCFEVGAPRRIEHVFPFAISYN